ncbi:MAG: hypothetical protein ACM3SY_11935 [Candidatus Omnitrophota bacterium]
MKRMISIMIIIYFLMVGFTVAWAGENRITASGVGPTQREALMAAQRKAVEQGVGVFLDSQSLSKNLELIEDTIFSKSRGYVKNVTVLSEKKLGDGNWQVTIACDVAADGIKDSLDAIGILRDKMGNPRIKVIYDPDITEDIPREYQPLIAQASEGINEYLTEREFPVVTAIDFTTMEKPSEKSDAPAEYILMFSIKRGKEESSDIFKIGWIMISSKIIQTATGQPVASENKKIMGADRETVDFAFRKAARKAGKWAGQFLEEKLVERWQAETVSGRVVVLQLINIKKSSISDRFDAELKKVYGIKRMIRRDSGVQSATYELMVVGDTGTLQVNICTVLKKIGLKPKNLTTSGDSIRIEM